MGHENDRSYLNGSLETIGRGPVAVIGLGKIGLPLAIQYTQKDRRVIGCDSNPRVVATVNAGHSHVREEAGLDAAVATAVARGLLAATGDTSSAVREAVVVVVIVPVVVDSAHHVDFAAIDAATAAIGRGLTPGTLVIYETTLPVGTTSTRFRPILERSSGLVAGQDFWLAYSPERVSSGSVSRDLRTYPKIVGGIDSSSTEAVAAFYRSVLDAEITVMAKADDAEFVKLIETTYRDVNIALANEFARFADLNGLDMAKAREAANTQPYSHIHDAGVGVGGHCIPVYPYFLLHQSEQGLTLPRLARAINDDMARYAVQRVEAQMGPVEHKAALILGLAYRGDVREHAFTSAKLLHNAFAERGATVFVDDPLFSADEIQELGYRPLTAGDFPCIDAIVLQAGHRAYHDLNWSQFPQCRVVLDGRGALRREVIEAHGMRYITIGDGMAARTSMRMEMRP